MTFKISTPEGKKMDETLVKKLVELVQAEIRRSNSSTRDTSGCPDVDSAGLRHVSLFTSSP